METTHETTSLQELDQSIPRSDLEDLSIVYEGDRLFARIYVLLTVFALGMTLLGL